MMNVVSAAQERDPPATVAVTRTKKSIHTLFVLLNCPVQDNLRRACKEQGISQTVLAQLSNVGLRFLCEVEHEKSTVRFDKLLSVLTSLGITLRLEMPSETSHA